GEPTRVEIERRDPAIGRLQNRQPFDRQIGAARSAREPQVRLRIVANSDDARTALRRDVEIVRFRVEAAALPERASGAARVVPGAFGAALLDLGGRREQGTYAILPGNPDGFGPKLRREVDKVILDVALGFVGGWLGRMGLRGPRMFAGDVACRYRALYDRPDRLPRHAIEHIRVALLGKLHQRFDRLALDRHVHEGRSGGKVVVPDVVVRDLVVPDALAGF